MSRTANSSFCHNSGVIRLVLCMLIGCLAVHFLVEDVLLFTVFAPLDPAAAGASQVNYDEIEHLDDLAYAARLLANVSDRDKLAAFPWNTPFILQTRISIFKPPKI